MLTNLTCRSTRISLAGGLAALAFAASACGGGEGSTYAPQGAPSSGYQGGGAPADPAAAREEQRKNMEALSNSAQQGHDARMDAYDSITP
jgi:hypothetical protein